MADKSFIQSLENFKGLDLKTSKLQGAKESGQLLTNLEYSESRGLRGRTGCVPIGQVGGFSGVSTYNYLDTTSGATTQELLAINQFLWRLKTATLSVTGGANVNWQNTINSGSGHYRFVIQNNTTPYVLSGNNYLDLKTGTESENGNLLVTMEDLRAAIDANATLACALPAGLKFARVNGNQTGVSSITVDAGHNYAIGDWLTFFDYATYSLVARKVSATTGTSVTFSTSIFSTVTVKDNQVIGPMAAPATSIDVRDVTTQTTNIDFAYWDVIPYTTDFFQLTANTPFYFQWAAKANDSVGRKPTYFLNSNNNAYIYSGITDGYVTSFEGFPFKYDGQTVYREGLPRHAIWGAAVGGAGALTGTYKYRVQYTQYDARGGIYQGRTTESSVSVAPATNSVDLTLNHMMIAYDPALKGQAAQVNGNQVGVNTITMFTNKTSANDFVYFLDRSTGAYIIRKISSSNSTTSLTISGAAVNVNNGDYFYFAKNVGFNYNSAQVNGNQATVTTITVFNTTALPNTFRVGDTAYFYDRLTTKYVARKITAVTATTIAIAGDAVSVNNNDVISNNLRVTVWRTKAGGNLFYFVADVPHNANSITFTYNDNLADTSLGAQLIEPPIGKEQDLPPRASFACNHQGTRCSSGDIYNPNTVYIYSTIDAESVPIASNSFDVQSQINGPISAIGSDDDDRLAIFKNHAYYQASGGLDDGSFSVQTIKEGDFGVSCQSSLVKVNGVLVGIGPLGVIGVQGGQIISTITENIYPPVANNPYIKLDQAVAINDYASRHYLFFIPSKDTTSNGYPSSLSYALDYATGQDAWFDRSYTRGFDPGGGMSMYNDSLYYLPATQPYFAAEDGRIFKRLTPSATLTTPSNLYWDVNVSIPYVFEPQWLTPDGMVSLDKEIQWFKLYCAPSTYELDRFTGFTPTLTTYANFNEATPLETLTLPALSTTAFESRIKLKSTKVRSILFKVSVNTGGQCLYLTGFEYTGSFPYLPDAPRTT